MNHTKFWYSISAIIASMMAMLVVNIIYTNHVANTAVKANKAAIAESQRQLCTVLVPVTNLYRQATTPLGKELAVVFIKLVDDYHCVGG